MSDAPATHPKTAELDGIRGVAILLVMAYHCGRFAPVTAIDKVVNEGFNLGWVGVDLFFGLSGFLITGILFDSKNRQRYLPAFFGRRALRIFPLYYCFLAGLTISSLWIVPSLAGSRAFLHLSAWYWLYGVNFMVARYGTWDAAPFDTGILWSLAIEEQFYLLWPFIVWKLPRKALMLLCIALLVCAFLFRMLLRWHGASPPAIYTLTPARMDALLVGAFAALLTRGPASALQLRRYATVALICGAILALIALGLDRSSNKEGVVMETLGFTGIDWIAFAVIVMARSLDADSPLRRMLRSRGLIFLGAYSYAVYMVHYLVRNLVFHYFPTLESLPTVAGLMFPWAVLRTACALAVAVAVALLSWHLIEKRCLALKRYFVYGPPIRE